MAARRVAGETRTRAVRLLSVSSRDDVATVRLDLAGTPYDVRVRRTTGEERHQLTCRVLRPSAVPGYEVLDVRPVG